LKDAPVQYNNLVFTNFYLGETGRRYRSLQKIVQPIIEPVSLAELKAHVRVETEDEDAYLLGLIMAARQYCEQRIERCFVDTRLEMKLDTFPVGIELPLPMPPFSPTPGRQAIEVNYLNVTLQELAVTEAVPVITSQPGTFLAHRASTPAVLTPNVNGYWPVTGPIRAAVTIRWWAGYGDSGLAVPKPIRHAILMLAAHWYGQREAVAVNIGNAPTVPYGVDELLSMFSWGSYA
jgi:uncharacterized phiE125 gp8 family phage protein